MKPEKFLPVSVTIISIPGFIFFIHLKEWVLAAICVPAFVLGLGTAISGYKKEKHEKEMDEKHSEEFKRVRRGMHSGYEYAYSEYRKDSFEKIYEWERSELEDMIWNDYLKGNIKFAGLLPYLEKYDGMSKLKEDLVSPDTPEGWKKEISFVLDLADKEKN